MYRVGEAARRLGVHEQTLRSWAEEGLVKCVRVGRRQERRFPASEIDRLLAAQNDNAGILYAREYESGETAQEQLARLHEWMKQHRPGAEAIEVIEKSSEPGPDRPGLNQVISLVQERRTRFVAVTTYDRLTGEWGIHLLRRLWEGFGVRVIALEDSESWL